MIDKQTFKTMFAKTLQKEGFCRNGQTWYLSGQELVHVFNLQKSDYANSFYINTGIWIKSLGQNEAPKVNHCHIQLDLSSLFKDSVMIIERACSLDESSTEDLQRLAVVLETEAVPFFCSLVTEGDLAKKYAEGVFRSALILRDAKEKLLMGS